jgi:putative zinc finger/helix-turn-helix YgiT family protein
MKKQMECPLCDGMADITIKKNEFILRKEKFMINEHFYKCHKCGEEFTTNEIDKLNLNQVFNLYREKHRILFPDQIAYLRNKYGFSAAKMSEILGFGTNQYSKYEKGEIPNESNATLLSLIQDPAVFKNLVLGKKELFSETQFNKLIGNLNSLKNLEHSHYLKNHFWSPSTYPNRFTGFRIPDYDKFANVSVYFIDKVKPFMVKLNKLLFYADFYHFKRTGFSITGTQYLAFQHGPVPDNYDILFGILSQENILGQEYVEFEFSDGATRFFSNIKFNSEIFDKEELETLDEVHKKLGKVKTTDIKDLSHDEIGWIHNHNDKEIISYMEYAFSLKAI